MRSISQWLKVLNFIRWTNGKNFNLHTIYLHNVINTVNYRAKLIFDDGTLFIGFGINHPSGGVGLSDDSDSSGKKPSRDSDGLDGKPPTVIGVRYFACCNVLFSCFFTILNLVFGKYQSRECVCILWRVRVPGLFSNWKITA